MIQETKGLRASALKNNLRKKNERNFLSNQMLLNTMGSVQSKVYGLKKFLHTSGHVHHEAVALRPKGDTECSIYSHIHRALTAQFPAAGIMGAWVWAADHCHPVFHHPPSMHKLNSQDLGLVCYSLTTGKK